MNLRLPLALLTLGGLLLGTDCFASQQVFISFQEPLPQTAVSFDDLDARDAKNQPINSIAAQEELRTIFRSGLYSLLLDSQLYSVAQALSVLRKKLNPCADGISSRLPAALGHLIVALVSSLKKQWDLTLTRLSGLPAFSLFILSFLLPVFALSSVPPRTGLSVVFRC